ncbi:MAG: hypothetical protein AAFO82_24310, partial [Bacteroidota bacterium]
DRISEIEVLFYYNKEIQLELDNSGLFLPKDEFETQFMYNTRVDNAKKYRTKIIDKYQRKLDLDRQQQEQVKENKIKNSLSNIELSLEYLGQYQPEEEDQYFPVKINGKSGNLKVPLREARSFKTNRNEIKITAQHQLKAFGESYDTFNVKVIHPMTKSVYPFGEQRTPLYIGKTLITTTTTEEEGIPELIPSVKLIEPSGNNLLDARESGSLQLTIYNKGKGTARNIKTDINWESIPSLNIDKAGVIDRIGIGEKAIINIPIQATELIKSTQLNLQFSFDELNGFPPPSLNIHFGTQGLKVPEVVFLEAGIEETQGNGNNIIENAEVIKVTAILKNQGEITARDVRVDVIIADPNII